MDEWVKYSTNTSVFIYNQCTKSSFPKQAANRPGNTPLFVHGSHPVPAVTINKPCFSPASYSAPGASPPLPAPLCFSPVFPAMLSHMRRHSAASRSLLCACRHATRTLSTHTLLICDSSRFLPAFREWLLLLWPSRYIRKLSRFLCPSAAKLGYCIHHLQYHRTRYYYCTTHTQVPEYKIALWN